MAKFLQKRVSKEAYLPISILRIEGFMTPFKQHLDPTNRWIVLSPQVL